MNRLITFLVATVLLAASVPGHTQTPGSGLIPGATSTAETVPTGDPSPNDVRELMRLLSDPDMVEWLRQKADDTASASEDDALSMRETVEQLMAGARVRAAGILAAFASLPEGIEDLINKADEVIPPGRGWRAASYVIIFLFVGAGLEWLFWQYFYPLKLRIEIRPLTSLSQRFTAALGRLGLAGAAIVIFAIGSIGAFLAFEWPPLLEWMVVSLLLAVVIFRAVVAFSLFVFAPRVPRLRLVPLGDTAARQANRWVIGTAFVWIAGLQLADSPRRMVAATGAGPAGQATAEAIAGIIGIIISLTVIAAIWRLSPQVARTLNSGGPASRRSAHFNLMPVVQTALVILIMVSWFGGIHQITGTLIIAALVMPVLHLARVLIDHFYDEAERTPPPFQGVPQETGIDPSPEAAAAAAAEPPGQEIAGEPAPEGAHYDYQRPIVHRIARLLIIVAAILVFGAIWGVNIHTLSQSPTTLGRVVGVAIDISAALLIADLVWTWAKTAIDRKLQETGAIQNELGPGPEARILTLLPIFRMTLLIVLLTIVGLTLLSSLGVNIAPLLAGAGVIGIAIGFGAQALVRDVVSGIFFLLDDAFRVGEYIEMENLRGTVESMSLRSLKVRHHRGAVHTIPFGELKSLTNYSRDWVMMKLEFRVPFDTDLMLVKKIVKRVGAELKAHEGYGKHIIETLKSQGVRRMEEFNMVVGVKFMAKPGAQWVIRRDAYQKLRDEFEKAGINFAERNVKVQVVSDRPLTDAEHEAAVGAAQDAIEQQLGPEGAKPAPDEP